MGEEHCPVCNSSQNAKEHFATAKVAEHVQQKARRDDDHREWISGHTENGTVAEIRTALRDESPPR